MFSWGMNPLNDLELVPCETGLLAVVTNPNGEVSMSHMSWPEFVALKAALAADDDERKETT